MTERHAWQYCQDVSEWLCLDCGTDSEPCATDYCDQAADRAELAA